MKRLIIMSLILMASSLKAQETTIQDTSYLLPEVRNSFVEVPKPIPMEIDVQADGSFIVRMSDMRHEPPHRVEFFCRVDSAKVESVSWEQGLTAFKHTVNKSRTYVILWRIQVSGPFNGIDYTRDGIVDQDDFQIFRTLFQAEGVKVDIPPTSSP